MPVLDSFISIQP